MRRIDGARDEMSDAALLAACATGENAALGALFDRYAQRVFRFVASRVRTQNDTDLDDLVQLTFIEVAKSAGRFRGRSAVSTWIFGVANNVVRHHLRSEGRRRRLVKAVVDDRRSDAIAAGGVAEAERRRALRLALDELSDPLREAFALVYLEGLSGRDAADVIGCREGTLYKRLHQARKTLRERLNPQGEER